MGDRYVIRIGLDERAVGLYAVGYGVAAALSALVTRPLNLFAFPAYTKIWDTRGGRDTSTLLARIMERYLMIYLPLVAIAWMWGGQAIRLLAGARYVEAAPVVTIVFVALFFQGAATVTVAGLYLENRTLTVGLLSLGMALLNLGANALVVPRAGILGAALVTLGTYLAYFAAVSAFGLRRLGVPLAVRRIGWTVLACCLAAAMAMGLERWAVVPFPAAIVSGVLAYVWVLAGTDPELRRAVVRLGRRITLAFGKAGAGSME